MADVITALLLLIGDHTGHHLSQLPPIPVTIVPYRHCRPGRVGNIPLCQNPISHEIDLMEYTIYLPYDIDPENEEDRARLLHECTRWT